MTESSSGWLQSRLSPVKRDTDRWQQLAEAIERYYAENFDDLSGRLDSLKSIFTAGKADQLAILYELGKYYDIDLPDDNLPLAVIQRRMELFQKDTLVPLTESLRRSCQGVSFEWLPLWSLSQASYGSKFYTERDLRRLLWWPIPPATHYLDGSWNVVNPTNVFLGNNKDEQLPLLYLTSRGMLFVDESTTNIPDMVEGTLRDRVEMVLPLHIVLHGLIWAVMVAIEGEIGGTATDQRIVSWDVLPVFTCRLKVDGSWILDGSTYLCANNGDLHYQYPVK